MQISTLMGTTVVNPQGQKLGQIKDVLLDSQSAQATFVIVDTEIAGTGHAMLVAPYQALRLSVNPADNRPSAVLDLRPDQLHAVPQIQANKREMLQNPQFLEQARSFYQPRTYTAARPIDNQVQVNPSMVPLPPPCPMPAPYVDSSGLTPALDDFYNE